MSKIKISNVRLSFPSLFKKPVFDNVESRKYEATFLINKKDQADQIAKINATIESFLNEKFGEAKRPKGIKLTCMKDGDDIDYDGYEGHMAFKAGNQRRPLTIDKDRTPLVEDDNKLYAGCYVNAIVSLWYSDHISGGKQVLANLEGVQFFKNGTAFADGGINVSEFDLFSDDDDVDDFM